MEILAPTLTVHLSTDQLPKAMAHLLTWCIQEAYGFLHTCHDAGHSEVTVLDPQQRSLVRLLLYALPSAGPAVPSVVWDAAEPLPVDMAAFVQHLIQLCTAV